jgi:16S rRNA (guanine(966)-N(2))-methyltransferase RsmD
VRIIGGVWRSRLLRFPDAPGLRPTADRIRETVFNWLGQDLTGLACLDLYAGSGALGFEAASRGAAEVTLVERHPAAYAALQENAQRLQAQITLVKGDALEFLSRGHERFDVIFVDPPFAQGLPDAFLERLSVRLAPRGRVYLESDRSVSAGPGWRITRQGRAGNVHFRIIERDEPVAAQGRDSGSRTGEGSEAASADGERKGA